MLLTTASIEVDSNPSIFSSSATTLSTVTIAIEDKNLPRDMWTLYRCTLYTRHGSATSLTRHHIFDGGAIDEPEASTITNFSAISSSKNLAQCPAPHPRSIMTLNLRFIS